MRFWLTVTGFATALLGLAFVAVTFERPPLETVQSGFRGTSMGQVYTERALNASVPRNLVPTPPEPADPDPGGTRASEIYENVQVLGHLSIEQFNRIMQVMTEWIYPNENIAEGCNGCHVPGNFAAEDVYAKHVARRMIQMVWTINSTWSSHVQQVGVTCYTCHRGRAVPANVWSQAPLHTSTNSVWQNSPDMNRPVAQTGWTTLPTDPFTAYLLNDVSQVIQSRTARERNNPQSIQATEWNYSLMMHFSTALGVNCTFCHNSRNFSGWEDSPPQRLTAWHGIRMVREVNNEYIEPLRDRFPPHRLGPMGDVLKVNCATCHQGVYQPLFGAPMLRDFPELNPPPRQAAMSVPAPN
jgi:photosynthetic reaction center cytochrome c subunit